MRHNMIGRPFAALLLLCLAATTLPAPGRAEQPGPRGDADKALCEAAQRTYELLLVQYKMGEAQGPARLELLGNWSKRILMAEVREAAIQRPIGGPIAPKARREHIRRMEELEKLVQTLASAGAVGAADAAAAKYFRLEAATWVTPLEAMHKLQQERELDVKLPAATEARPLSVSTARLIINVARNGGFVVNDKVLDVERLGKMLQAARANNPQQAVMIRADKDVPFQHVATVLGLCAKHGLETQISVAGRKADPEWDGEGNDRPGR